MSLWWLLILIPFIGGLFNKLPYNGIRWGNKGSNHPGLWLTKLSAIYVRPVRTEPDQFIQDFIQPDELIEVSIAKILAKNASRRAHRDAGGLIATRYMETGNPTYAPPEIYAEHCWYPYLDDAKSVTAIIDGYEPIQGRVKYNSVVIKLGDGEHLEHVYFKDCAIILSSDNFVSHCLIEDCDILNSDGTLFEIAAESEEMRMFSGKLPLDKAKLFGPRIRELGGIKYSADLEESP